MDELHLFFLFSRNMYWKTMNDLALKVDPPYDVDAIYEELHK